MSGCPTPPLLLLLLLFKLSVCVAAALQFSFEAELQACLAQLKPFTQQRIAAQRSAFDKQLQVRRLPKQQQFQHFLAADDAATDDTLFLYKLNGFSLHSDTFALLFHFALSKSLHKPLAFTDAWPLTDALDCPQQNWHCFFEPLSNASVRHVPPFSVRRWTPSVALQQFNVLFDWTSWTLQPTPLRHAYPQKQIFGTFARFSAENELFFCQQLLRFLWRPNAATRAKLSAKRSKLLLQRGSGKVLAVVVSKDADALAMEALVERALAREQPSVVLLLLDDDTNDKFQFPPTSTRVVQLKWSEPSKTERKTAATMNNVVNLLLLSECDALVASMKDEKAKIAFNVAQKAPKVYEIDEMDPYEFKNCILV